MSTFYIPNSQGRVQQVNHGDLFGELWGSFNIDLIYSPGKVKSSKALTPVLTSVQLGTTKRIQSICLFGGYYYIATQTKVFRCLVGTNPTVTANWTELATFATENLTVYSDASVFNGLILFSLGTDIASYNGTTKISSWWVGTVGGTALTNNVPHIMEVQRTGIDTLFVTDGNKIRYYNSTAGHSLITLDNTMTACAIATGVDATWVGTFTSTESQAFVYEIFVGETTAGGTPVAHQAYPIDGRAVLAMCTVDNIPYIVTDKGHIQAFNGAGFVTIGSFPFAHSSVSLSGVAAGLVQNPNDARGIHPKAMKVNNGIIHVFTNTALEYTPTDGRKTGDERSASGIWTFDPATKSLNHMSAITMNANQRGHHYLSNSGPLYIVDDQYTRFMCGAQTSASENGLFVDGTYGESYIITPEITATSVTEAWEKVYLKTTSLSASNLVSVKYRTTESLAYPLNGTVTWLNANTFTSIDTAFLSIIAGNEVELLNGTFAGRMCNVLSVVVSGATITVTVDTTFGVLNDTCFARVQNWAILETKTSGDTHMIGINQTAGWVQFKVVMSGQVELRQFISKGNADKSL